MSIDDANTTIDAAIERAAEAMTAMTGEGINQHQMISMFVGSWLGVAQRVNPFDLAATHALCLTRLVEWRELINQLEDEADMLHACMATLDELEEL